MKIERYRRLALVSAFATLLLASIGALVRATGSGLGCLDSWPRCAGGWIAPAHYHALIEYSHRAAAVIVVVSLAALLVASWVWVRDVRAFAVWSAVGVGIVFAQAGLGGLVVRTQLHATLVTAHYLTALALVGVTSGLAVGTYVVG